MKNKIINVLLIALLFKVLNAFYSFVNIDISMIIGLNIIFIVSVLYAVYETITE